MTEPQVKKEQLNECNERRYECNEYAVNNVIGTRVVWEGLGTLSCRTFFFLTWLGQDLVSWYSHLDC